MLVLEREGLGKEIAEICERHGRERAALLPILQDLQDKRGWISDYAMQEVANHLDVHPVEVYSVLTFYSFLSGEKKGRFVIRLCRTVSCDMQGKDRVARQLQTELGVPFGATTPDGRFTLEYTNCMGMCDQGPALMVNKQIFTRVTPQRVHEILEACRRVWGLYPERSETATMELAGAMHVEEAK